MCYDAREVSMGLSRVVTRQRAAGRLRLSGVVQSFAEDQEATCLRRRTCAKTSSLNGGVEGAPLLRCAAWVGVWRSAGHVLKTSRFQMDFVCGVRGAFLVDVLQRREGALVAASGGPLEASGHRWGVLCLGVGCRDCRGLLCVKTCLLIS